MKFLYITSLFLVLSISVQAQQLQQQSLWLFDPTSFNPALLSAENQNVFGAHLRSQWTGIEGAPSTQSVYYTGQIQATDYLRVGFLSDQAGAFGRKGVEFGYTKTIKAKENLSINLGLRAGLFQSSFNEADMNVFQLDDPEVTGETYTALTPAITPGLAISTDGWQLGISVPYALESSFQVSSSELAKQNKWQRQWQGSLSKTLLLNDQLSLTPSVWLMSTPGAATEVSMNILADVKETVTAGLGYRNNSDLALIIGGRFKSFALMYSYDMLSSSLSSATSGSHEIGLQYRMNSKYADSDGDGIPNDKDACPEEFGKLNGCPDNDQDGVADKDDQCPNEYGTIAGCPDTDGDGIPDKLDQCPELAGSPNFSGCPDTDGDGIPDHLDSCPKTPATDNSNDGCPVLTEEQKQVIAEAFGNLEFETGKAKIKETSFAFLIKLAMLMKENPTWLVDLAGHTDNVGTEEGNMTLSKDRVQAVVDFLVTLEVPQDRMVVSYFGETKPIDSNDTEAGRAKNRRVEMKFIFE